MGRIRAVLDAVSDVFRLDPGPSVQPVSSLSLAVGHYRSTAAERGLDKTLDSSSIAFRKRFNEVAQTKREALLVEAVEELDRVTVLIPLVAERYRDALLELAKDREPSPKDIDALKERFRRRHR